MDQKEAVAELSDREFRLWRHHPVSRVLLRYLADYRQELRQDLLLRWLHGSTRLSDPEELEARGRLLAFEEFEELEWAIVQNFYGIEPEEKPEDTNEETYAT